MKDAEVWAEALPELLQQPARPGMLPWLWWKIIITHPPHTPSLGDPSPRGCSLCLSSFLQASWTSRLPFSHISPRHQPKFHYSAHVTVENVKTQLIFGNTAQADAAELPPPWWLRGTGRRARGRTGDAPAMPGKQLIHMVTRRAVQHIPQRSLLPRPGLLLGTRVKRRSSAPG